MTSEVFERSNELRERASEMGVTLSDRQLDADGKLYDAGKVFTDGKDKVVRPSAVVMDAIGDTTCESRIVNNWVTIAAAYRTIETLIDLPFTYADIFKIITEGIRRQNAMTTTYFRNGAKMEGTINSNRDGLFYTSVPYEKGWRAYVDGQEVEITPVGGSLLAFPLSKGEHSIVLKYAPNGFWPGLAVSLVCLAGFTAFCVFTYVLKRKLIPDFAMDKAYKKEEDEAEEEAE